MKYKIILASNSPRRRELLAGLDIPFDVRVLPSVDESYPETLQAGDIPLYISREKANAYRELIAPDELIITADTIVWLEGAILEKPHDDAEAVAMLHRLSGKTHEVFTGVTLTTRHHQKSFVAESKVTFATLSDAEIDYYVAHYHPLDKAGAYGVQEWIGYVGVERIEGSFYNVMGLPVRRLYEALASFPSLEEKL
ncbi:MAG: septum formation protein Maf [Bacteroidaceae bacterium]|nr:septum formation protein Maf [Bacteroidaceae bacterium]